VSRLARGLRFLTRAVEITRGKSGDRPGRGPENVSDARRVAGRDPGLGQHVPRSDCSSERRERGADDASQNRSGTSTVKCQKAMPIVTQMKMLIAIVLRQSRSDRSPHAGGRSVARQSAVRRRDKARSLRGGLRAALTAAFPKRLMGLEPTTFCMEIVCEFRIKARLSGFRLNAITGDYRQFGHFWSPQCQRPPGRSSGAPRVLARAS